MDTINMVVLAELKEYAQSYFSAIVELHTVEGKCNLKPGKYSAKELVDNLKAACGSYGLPTDEIFNEDIEISVETINCKFPYRRIFAILAQWEVMSKAGKQKAVFEIGEVEEKSVKVLLNDKTECGAFKTKSVRLQHITGNWWMPRKLPKSGDVALYYELNGVMFIPGLRVFSHEDAQMKCPNFDDVRIKEMLLSFLAKWEDSDNYDYFKEVAVRAGIDFDSEETVRIIETARKEAEIQREESRKLEEEEKIKREQAKREQMEREAEEERQYKESRKQAKEKFISGKMISLNEFEMTAELVGYKFNIRTLGTLRKRASYIEVDCDGTPTVYGTKKRSGLDGSFAAIREVYELAKAMSDKEPEQAATPTETPQISTETANVEDMERHYNIVAPAYYKHTLYKFNEQLYAFGKDADLLREFFSDNRWIELKWVEHNRNGICYLRFHYSYMDAIKNFLKKKLNLDNILIGVWDSEEVEYWCKRNISPQPPETPQKIKHTTHADKPRETARKEPKRTISKKERFHTQQKLDAQGYLMLADASATLAANNAPPIRGDCMLIGSTR